MDVRRDDRSLHTSPLLIADWREQYSSPLADARHNRDWHEAAARKLWGSGSEMRTAFIVSTSVWWILSGAFIIRNMPVPANSDMLRVAPRVIGVYSFGALVMGAETQRETALLLCAEAITSHTARIEAATAGRWRSHGGGRSDAAIMATRPGGSNRNVRYAGWHYAHHGASAPSRLASRACRSACRSRAPWRCACRSPDCAGSVGVV
jgi:hypothetical protein